MQSSAEVAEMEANFAEAIAQVEREIDHKPSIDSHHYSELDNYGACTFIPSRERFYLPNAIARARCPFSCTPHCSHAPFVLAT